MENSQKEKPDTEKSSKPNQKVILASLLQTGIEFAIILGLPLYLLIMAGKWLDQKQNTHFFVLIGILLALSISSFAIYKRIKEITRLLK